MKGLVRMVQKNRCWSSNQKLLQIISIVFGLLMGVMAVSSIDISSESIKSEDAEPQLCSQESCEELRERVETLEEAVRIIVSSVLDEEKNPYLTDIINRKMIKNPALKSVLIPALSIREEEAGSNEKVTEVSFHQRSFNKSSTVNVHTNTIDANIRAENDDLLNSTYSNKATSYNPVYQLKQAVKCSQAHILDINVSANNNGNYSAGILTATLVRQEASDYKATEIEWSPPLASCIEFITGLWIRVYESGTNETSEPYLSIPKKCLKSKQHPTGRETLSMLLPSNSSTNADAECSFSIQALIICRSYQVEVIPDYQSLRGKSIQAEMIIPPTMDSMTRLESSMNVSVAFDSLALNWEDNSGCASRLSSINLRLWPDGLKTTAIEPISYRIPQNCFELLDGNNLFSLMIPPDHHQQLSSCLIQHVQWKPLEKCRKYLFEMESQYSSSWTGPSSSQTIFTSAVTHTDVLVPDDSSLLISDPIYDREACSTNTFYCDNARDNVSGCLSVEWLCDGSHDCPYISPLHEYQHVSDEFYCDSECLNGFKCGRQCIPLGLVCDGNKDCFNGNDESLCPAKTKLSSVSSLCRHLNSSSGSLASESNGTVNQGSTTVLISAEPNQIIWMDFAKLKTDAEKRKKFKIYDGPYSTSPVLLSHDGFKKPSSVRSTGPDLYVEYYSYQDETHAYYTTMKKPEQKFVDGCGGYVNGDGVITSPTWEKGDIEDKEHPDDCFWFIEARHEGETLLLKTANKLPLLLGLDVRQIHPMIVYDGWNTSGVVLCDDRVRNNTNDIVYSSSSKMMVHFYKPSNVTKPLMLTIYWNVTTISTPNCKENLTGSYTGVVKSTNYPAPYPKSSDCHWTISTEPGTSIRLLFAFFETRKNKDIVYVYEGSTVYHPLLMERSGTASTPFMVNSTSNQVLVRFTSSDIGEWNSMGFLAVYSVV